MSRNRSYIAILALLAFVLAACNSSQPAGDVAAGPAQGDAIRIEAGPGQVFTPSTLELPAGEEATVEVTNVDGEAHDFAIESMGLNTGTLEQSDVATATFTVPEGTTQFVCTFHDGMTGTIEGRS
jgi:plastocyanin